MAWVPCSIRSSLRPNRSESSIDSSGRRASSAALRSRPSASENCAGVLDVACQPSPSVATRRNAPGLSPPTQIGGCGFCTGLGANPTSRKRKNSPSKAGLSWVHSALNTRSASSAWRPRWWNGAPRISSSSFHQPTPTPTISRPCESASIEVSILAMTTGWRWPRMKTEAPSRARVVHMAAAVSVITGSRYGLSGGWGNRPPG